MSTNDGGAGKLGTYAVRTRRVLSGVSVRTKILGIMLALTTILGLGVTLQVRAAMGRTLTDELDSRGLSVASDLAGRSVEPILLDDTPALHDLLSDTVTNHPDALYAYAVSPNGRVLAHTFGPDGFPAALLDLSYDVPGELIYDSTNGRIHDFSEQILDGSVGVVHVGLSEDRIDDVIRSTTGQMLLTTFIVSILGIAAAGLLTWLLTRPIVDLVDTTKRVGSGDLTARASPWAEDEIGVLATSFNEMVEELETNQRRIAETETARKMLLHRLIGAQEEERKRIARDLHDGVGQSLNSIALGARRISTTAPEAADEARELEAMAGEALQIVRHVSRELRPSILDDLGLTAALENYVDAFQRRYPEIRVDAHFDLSERLDPAVETALYRLVQEAITNVARHANARTVSIVMGQRDGTVSVIVDDDGDGFDVAAVRDAGESVGIHGMAERAEIVGGSVRLESGADGTTVYIQVPA